MQQISVACPRCKNVEQGPFGTSCQCGFTIRDLSGQSTNPWIVNKDQQHHELLTEGAVSLFGKKYNASFTYNGIVMLEDLVRFTITYGSRTTIPSIRGAHPTEIILAFVPEVIGSGTSVFEPGLVPCSGIVLMSPGSMNHGHSFPALQQYVNDTFSSLGNTCKSCGKQIDFGQPFCVECYYLHNIDWRELI